MKYLSICSGIEAASVAWHPLGWTPIGFSEIEPFPSAVLAHHYPTITNYGDMTKYEQWNIKSGTVDLLVGGTPCQSFSVAGLRQGLKDPRGNLMLTFLAIAERIKPKWIVWENVPGVLSSNGGKDFGSFLGGLGELGYGFAYRVLDAQWVRTQRHPRAVPQRRRRVFVVACAGDHISPAKVLFESESMLRYSAKSKATRQGIAEDVAGCIRSGGDGGVPSSRGEHLVFDESKPVYCGSDTNASDTVTSKWQKQSGGPAGSECGLFVLQPFDQQRIGVYGTGEVGSAVVARGHKSATDVVILPFTKSKRAQSTTDNETWVEGVVAPTQNAFDVGDTRATTAILFENHPNDSRVTGPHDVAPSCVSRYGTGGGNVPLVIPAVAIQGTVIGRQDHNGPQGSGCSDDGEMFTLNSTDVHAVAFQQNTRDEVRLMNGDGQIAGALAAESGMKQQNYLASTTMQVRRLTPKECERLQGFPDGWTAIPWKKKSADDCPDGPRYKALGNSMAVNCMEWIGERIATVNATMDRP